jgi:hypothetical protein
VLEAERGETKDEAKLDERIRDLQARQTWIANYRQRRIERSYNGSTQIEKANVRYVQRKPSTALRTSHARVVVLSCHQQANPVMDNACFPTKHAVPRTGIIDLCLRPF